MSFRTLLRICRRRSSRYARRLLRRVLRRHGAQHQFQHGALPLPGRRTPGRRPGNHAAPRTAAARGHRLRPDDRPGLARKSPTRRSQANRVVGEGEGRVRGGRLRRRHPDHPVELPRQRGRFPGTRTDQPPVRSRRIRLGLLGSGREHERHGVLSPLLDDLGRLRDSGIREQCAHNARHGRIRHSNPKTPATGTRIRPRQPTTAVASEKQPKAGQRHELRARRWGNVEEPRSGNREIREPGQGGRIGPDRVCQGL